MATVYILYSAQLDKFYTGSCLDFEQRLIEHRTGSYQGAFTSRTIDWYIHLKISDLEYKTARRIEKHIKDMKSRKYIINLKRYPEMVEKLIERFSSN